jgi:hypothetical protein
MAVEKNGRLTILKIVLLLHASGVLTQAVFAGQFLSGDDHAVAFHETVAYFVLGACLLQILFSIALKGAPLWFIISSVFAFLGEGLQVGTGYGRFLNVHIPLSILIMAGVMCQVMWSFGSRRKA